MPRELSRLDGQGKPFEPPEGLTSDWGDELYRSREGRGQMGGVEEQMALSFAVKRKQRWASAGAIREGVYQMGKV